MSPQSPAAGLPAQTPPAGETTAGRLLSVAETATWLGVSPSYVYRHASELAAIRLPGTGGERRGGRGGPRLRFDQARTLAALTSSSGSLVSEQAAIPVPEPKPAAKRGRRTVPQCQRVPILGGDDA
jgi:hypothetical protein